MRQRQTHTSLGAGETERGAHRYGHEKARILIMFSQSKATHRKNFQPSNIKKIIKR